MTIKEFEKQIIDALAHHETIINILESDNSLLINCCDKSCFFINILESKFTFIHNDCDEEAEKYFLSHSKKEYVQDILRTAEIHPAFFLYFMIFSKMKEMGIIDRCLYYHILDNIVHYEYEFEQFIVEIIHQINGNKNDN